MTAADCAPSTLAHRRWARWWSLFAGATFTTGAVLDVVAYRRHGYPATLTCFLRRTFGIDPRTRFAGAGQTVLGVALGWALVHLVWGVLGPTRGRVQ